MRTRLVIAFMAVALLAALLSSWFHTLIESYRLPAWLRNVVLGPDWLRGLLYTRPGQPALLLVPHTALIFFLAEAVVLLTVIALAAMAAARPVLLPVRRLARAAQRMSAGDLTVRIQPRGRDELAQLVTSFNGMAAALEDQVGVLQQMEARARQFAGDVSHELRTPLTAMTAVAGILHEHPDLTGDAATAAQLVQHEVLHLNRLVEDLIEISRFDAGTAQLVIDETDLARAVGQCLRTRGWSTVETDVPAGLTARLDRRRFDVILANLVGNALRHGRPPVTVRVSTEPAAPGGGQLVMAVRDHGPGLAPAAIPQVFDRFYKSDTARTRSDGSGLGLAIAWENARLHGGHLQAANHPDGGAVFTARLPLDATVAVPSGREAAEAGPRPGR
jgi:two-component system, OmpR family, sensor histidine kinase MtrB